MPSEVPLTVFIDEAGDPGVKDGLRYASTRHEWLCLSAVIVRTSRFDELIGWIKDMRATANARQPGALHYHRITPQRRTAVCAMLASKPAKAFILATHKTNLREYINPRIGKMMDAGTFYNWCLRLLLERVTAWAERWLAEEGLPIQPIRVAFAERGGHNYDGFFSYVDLLRMQALEGTLFLKGSGLHPLLLDRSSWQVLPADRWAGLQLADVVASAFYQAANSMSPNWDLGPAKALLPIMPEDKRGGQVNVGVTVWPLPHQAALPDASKEIFRACGYRF